MTAEQIVTAPRSASSAQTAGEYLCQVCGLDGLTLIDAFRRLPRATSDSRPWPAGGDLAACEACGAIQKLPTPKWHEEASRIYAAYDIYHLGKGSEHPIFLPDGTVQPRSRLLVGFLVGDGLNARSGRMIDIGCGNGAALANFGAALPEWTLYGSELSDTSLPALHRIRNFVKLFTGELSQIEERFDLVTMIHALEHMVSPGQVLREAASLLNDGGRIFVQVPNVATAPFDLLIADHLMHFTPAHLAYLAGKAGLQAVVRDDVLPKEISMVAVRGPAEAKPPDAGKGVRVAAAIAAWLENVLSAGHDAAGSARSAGRPFGIFGSSNSSMWLYAPLREMVDFFVDEDKARRGSSYEGRPVLGTDEVPPGAVIFIPLTPPAAVRIADRLSGAAAYVPPPALPSLLQ